MKIERRKMPKLWLRTFGMLALLGGTGVQLSACSASPAAQEMPRTALVVQAGSEAGFAVEAFAGAVHARQESALGFRVGGQLARRLVDAGDRVQQGQVLAELDPGDSRLQLQAAQADMQRLQGDLQRYRKLLAQKLISQSAFDAQQAALTAAQAKYALMRNQSAYTQLRAPHAGVVASRQAEAGQVVAAGQPIFVLAADGGREVAISLPESRIREFHTGQAAMVQLWSAPQLQLSGKLREIAAAADPQTRTYAARVALDPAAAAQVRLGQSARVFIRAGAQAESLQLPLSAIQRDSSGATSVWVVASDGKVQTRKVRLGAFAETSVPVLEGLRATDWVVAAGGHLLHAGETVKPVDRRNRPVVVQER